MESCRWSRAEEGAVEEEVGGGTVDTLNTALTGVQGFSSSSSNALSRLPSSGSAADADWRLQWTDGVVVLAFAG